MTPPLPTVKDLVSTVATTEHTDLDRVRAAVALADDLGALGDELVNHFVEAARTANCSWAQIGAQLGVSKQAAQQAFVAPAPRRGRFGRRGTGLGGPRRMTEAARAAIIAAREEAGALGHDFVGTEHLLLALGEGSGTAAVALRKLGIDQAGIRRGVEAIVGRGTAGPSGHRPFSPRAKKVMELALRESIRLQQDRIGTEHLLLGLVREGEGVGAQVLVQQLDVDLAKVSETVLEIVSERGGAPTAG